MGRILCVKLDLHFIQHTQYDVFTNQSVQEQSRLKHDPSKLYLKCQSGLLVCP